MVEDRRLAQRYEINVETWVVTGGNTFLAVTNDLNRNGVCLTCPKDIQPGSTVGLALSCPEFSDEISVDAKVVWSTPVDGKFQTGATFVGLDENKKRSLRLIMYSLNNQQSVEKPYKSQFDFGVSDE